MARLTRTQYCRTALRAQTSILDSSSAIVSIMCARCVSDSAIRPPPSGLGVRMRGVEAARLPARLFLTGMLKRPMSSAAVPEATVERVTHGMVRRAAESVGEERVVQGKCGGKAGGRGRILCKNGLNGPRLLQTITTFQTYVCRKYALPPADVASLRPRIWRRHHSQMRLDVSAGSSCHVSTRLVRSPLSASSRHPSHG